MGTPPLKPTCSQTGYAWIKQHSDTLNPAAEKESSGMHVPAAGARGRRRSGWGRSRRGCRRCRTGWPPAGPASSGHCRFRVHTERKQMSISRTTQRARGRQSPRDGGRNERAQMCSGGSPVGRHVRRSSRAPRPRNAAALLLSSAGPDTVAVAVAMLILPGEGR